MTAISLYITTSKYVMQADASDPSSWNDLYRYLPYLRQALSCCACGNIITKPRGPSHGECLHNVCAACVGKKMKLKPSCSWCKEYEDFCENTHLRIVVLCFQKLCEYIHSSPIWSHLSSSAANGETNPLVSIINEALDFEDDYVTISTMPILPVVMPILSPATIKPVAKRRGSNREQHADDISEGSSPDPPTLSPECDTVPFEKEKNKSISLSTSENNNIELSNKANNNIDERLSPSTEINFNFVNESVPQRKKQTFGRHIKPKQHNRGNIKSKNVKLRRSKIHNVFFEPPSRRTRGASSVSEFTRKICKCARNNVPNRLTCLGQRCPCYSSKMACVGCMCRGCRNPRKQDGDVNNLNGTGCADVNFLT